jgi:hypothetical protein
VEAETRFPGKAPEIPVQHRGVGWVLLVSSWIMRVVGGLIAGISVGESRSAYTTAHDTGYHGPPWIVLVLLAIIVGVPLGILLVGAGMQTGRYARRHLVRVITSVADLTPGSYVLYLRPFEQDRPASSIDSGGGVSSPKSRSSARDARTRSGWRGCSGSSGRWSRWGAPVRTCRPGPARTAST